MKKKDKNDYISEINSSGSQIDLRIQDAIFSKKDTIITMVDKKSKFLQAEHFFISYDAENGLYKLFGDAAKEAYFFKSLFNFVNNVGVITIRTFLDEVSHQRFRSDGMSEPIFFQEVRMFSSDGKEIKQAPAFDLFMMMTTNVEKGKLKFDINKYQQQDIYCDEFGSFPAPEMLEKIKNIVK